MRILVISQYFPPEPGATSNRLLSFVEAMVSRGHKVTVVCEFPNYPVGRLLPKDKWRLFRVEKKGSYKIVRSFVLTFAKKNNIKRMLLYLSFAFSSFITAIFLKRHDIIFASSPPIFHTFTAMLAAKIKRSKFVLDIRDIWPDMALEIEAVTNMRMLKYGSYIEGKIYQNANMIFTTTKGFKRQIENRGGKGKTYVCYNGSFEKILNWNGDKKEFRQLKKWDNKIVIAYTGLIGLAQNLLEILMEIKNLNRADLLFVFIGDGPLKPEFCRRIKELQLKNVKVVDIMPLRDIIPYMYHSDMLLVSLKESEFFKTVIPSKFFDCMAAGRPIISNVDGELREIMEKNNTGIYFSLKEPGSFYKAINILAEDPSKRKIMGENGKKTVVENFLRSQLANNAVKLIETKIII